MRTYYDIQLGDHTITTRELHGEDVARAGRYLIAKTLLDLGAATVDPLSPVCGSNSNIGISSASAMARSTSTDGLPEPPSICAR